MLYIARTAHLQADTSIDCREIAEVDATIKAWVLLVLDDEAPASESAWRLVGVFVAEREALAAQRVLSEQIAHRGLATVSSLFPSAPTLERRTASDPRQREWHGRLPGVAVAHAFARSITGGQVTAAKFDSS